MKVLRKRASIIGSTLRSRSDEFKAKLVAELRADFKEPLRHGDIKPVVDKVQPDGIAGGGTPCEENFSFGLSSGLSSGLLSALFCLFDLVHAPGNNDAAYHQP